MADKLQRNREAITAEINTLELSFMQRSDFIQQLSRLSLDVFQQHIQAPANVIKELTLSALKRLRFLRSPEFELQRRCQVASTDSG